MKTGFKCTAYFKGKDGSGDCDNDCQWWFDGYGCPCAKGSDQWDGKENYLTRTAAKLKNGGKV